MTQILQSMGVKDTVVFHDEKGAEIHKAKCNWFIDCPYLKHLTACYPDVHWTFDLGDGYVTGDGGKSFMRLFAYINVRIDTDWVTSVDKIPASKKFCATCKYKDGKPR